MPNSVETGLKSDAPDTTQPPAVSSLECEPLAARKCRASLAQRDERLRVDIDGHGIASLHLCDGVDQSWTSERLSEVLRRDSAVQFAEYFDCRAVAVDLGCRLAVLDVVLFGVPPERETEFTDSRAVIDLASVYCRSVTFGEGIDGSPPPTWQSESRSGHGTHQSRTGQDSDLSR